MLEHQMKVLKGVAEDARLFRKELIKSKKWLNQGELLKLKKWLFTNFGPKHHEIVNDVLQPVVLMVNNRVA
ncbi:MAG: hypothetical protein HC896_15320 [Bacteroidales bacterium]|nr:hypothetical protein [Bacteroidales bacterium]